MASAASAREKRGIGFSSSARHSRASAAWLASAMPRRMAPTRSKPGRTAFQEPADWSARRKAPCLWDASHFEEAQMKRIQASIAAGLLGIALAGCSDMSHQEKSTVAGAAIGGVAGSALTNGSAAGTIGGAVVGGVVGHEVGKPYLEVRMNRLTFAALVIALGL